MNLPENKKFKVAVVGRNVRAALTCWELSEIPNLEITWLPSELDSDQRELPEWFIYPQSDAEKKEESGSLGFELTDLRIFFEGEKSVRLTEVPLKPESKLFRGIHLGVWQKIISLGLWNDPTPWVWESHGSRGKAPNPDWVLQNSLSLKRNPKFQVRLLEGRATLSFLKDILSKTERIHFGQAGQSVHGVQYAKNFEKHRLIYNAPFGVEEFDRVVWMSLISEPKSDSIGQTPAGPETLTKPHRLGSWRSQGVWVPASEVTTLPLFSLWIDPKVSGDFLMTGLFSSGVIKRVFAIPSELQGGEPGKVWLQVQDFRIEKNLDSLQTAKEVPSDPSLFFEFLFEMCPYLKLSKSLGSFQTLPIRDDHIVLTNPEFLIAEPKAGFLEAIPGPLSHRRGFTSPIRDRLKIPKPPGIARGTQEQSLS